MAKVMTSRTKDEIDVLNKGAASVKICSLLGAALEFNKISSYQTLRPGGGLNEVGSY